MRASPVAWHPAHYEPPNISRHLEMPIRMVMTYQSLVEE